MDAGFLHWVITHTLKALDQIGSFFNLDKFYLFNPDVLPASKLSVTSGCFSSKVHTTIAGKKWETQNPVPSFFRQNSEKYKNYFEGSTFLKIWNSSKIFRKLLVRPQKRTSLNFGKKIWRRKKPSQMWQNTPENLEKYHPKIRFPEAKSLFPTMLRTESKFVNLLSLISI